MSDSLSEILDDWEDTHKTWNNEGYQGLANLKKLLKALGYDGIEDFLVDNSGAVNAIKEWIGEQNLDEWKNKLAA